jgi:hypothetical protein
MRRGVAVVAVVAVTAVAGAAMTAERGGMGWGEGRTGRDCEGSDRTRVPPFAFLHASGILVATVPRLTGAGQVAHNFACR